MKIDAKIKWLIDEPQLDIAVDKIETVLIDDDYIEPTEDELIDWIENELAEKYGTSFYVADDDFVIVNKDKILQNN